MKIMFSAGEASGDTHGASAVSYTHLDVYKRQALAYTQMATPGTSAASNVGVIDMSRLDNPENPVYVKAAKEFTDYRSQVDVYKRQVI